MGRGSEGGLAGSLSLDSDKLSAQFGSVRFDSGAGGLTLALDGDFDWDPPGWLLGGGEEDNSGGAENSGGAKNAGGADSAGGPKKPGGAKSPGGPEDSGEKPKSPPPKDEADASFGEYARHPLLDPELFRGLGEGEVLEPSVLRLPVSAPRADAAPRLVMTAQAPGARSLASDAAAFAEAGGAPPEGAPALRSGAVSLIQSEDLMAEMAGALYAQAQGKTPPLRPEKPEEPGAGGASDKNGAPGKTPEAGSQPAGGQGGRPENPQAEAAPSGRLKGSLSLSFDNKGSKLNVRSLKIKGDGVDLALSGSWAGLGGLSNADLRLKLEKGENYTRLIPGFRKGLATDADLAVSARYDGATKTAEKGELELTAGSLAAVSDELAGGAKLKLSFSGQLEEGVKAELSAASDKITRTSQEGSIDFFSPKLDLKGTFAGLLSRPGFAGDVSLSADHSDGSPLLRLAANPDLKFAGPFEAQMAKLSLSGLGADVTGENISIALPEGAPPKILGGLKADINSYKELRAATGLDLAGEPLSLELRASEKDGAALAEGALSAKAFSVGALKTSGTTLKFAAESPFDSPILSLNLATGQGGAGMFQWAQGEATVSGMSRDSPAKVKAVFYESGKRELFSIAGSYSPGTQIHTIESLTFSPPGLSERLVLKAPVKITARAAEGASAPASVSLSDVGLSLGRAEVTFKGSLSPLDGAAEVRSLPYSVFKLFTDAELPEGAINLKASYKKGGSGSVSLQTDPTFRREGLPPLSFKADVKGEISGGRTLSGEGTVALPGPAGRSPAHIKFKAPLAPDGQLVRPDMSGPLSASFSWTGDAAWLWGFLGLPNRTLKGNTEVLVSVGGTLGKPVPSAQIYLARASYDDDVLSLYLSDISLEARADASGEKVMVLLDASDGGRGSVALEGTVALADGPRLTSRGQIKNLSPFHRDDFSVTLSALFSISGPLADLTISTRAVIEALEISLSKSIGGPSIQTLSIDQGFQPSSQGPKLDVQVSIPRGAYIRGRGLDSEWKGDIQVAGRAGEPLISGRLSPIRGFFTLLGKEFTFSGGGITFRSQRRLNPGLDIELHRNVADLTAIVRVQGTLDSPRLRFESNPPYPQDEVLAQVLFGKPASELSRFETIQLANSLRELAGVGSGLPNPLATMREALGLSVLRIGEASSNSDRLMEGNSFRQNLDLGKDGDPMAQAETAPTLEAGKYITDNIYVGVDQNLVDNSTGVRVEIELTPSISFTSRTSNTSSRVGVGWKHDY
jgi:translocation and assembly module TamB